MSGEEGAVVMFAMAAAVASLFVLYDWWTRRNDHRNSSRR